MGCGCSNERESIESQMLILKLKRNKIKEKKAIKIKEYEFVTGEKMKRPFIPDHIDHKYMRHIKGIMTPPPETKEEEKHESVEEIEDEDEEQGNNNLEIIKKMKTNKVESENADKKAPDYKKINTKRL